MTAAAKVVTWSSSNIVPGLKPTSMKSINEHSFMRRGMGRALLESSFHAHSYTGHLCAWCSIYTKVSDAVLLSTLETPLLWCTHSASALLLVFVLLFSCPSLVTVLCSQCSRSEHTKSIARRRSRTLEALYVQVSDNVSCSRLRDIHTLSHSSHALPAPNPRPAHTGHARRLNRRTEKITPNDAPKPERMRRVLRQWSH